MGDIIQLRGGTAAAWTLANPILANKELGVETDSKKMKLGDGTTTWTSLAYMNLAGEHAASHAIGQADALTPTAIGAAELYHNHQAGIEKDEITNLFPAITTGTGGDAGKLQIAAGVAWMYDEGDMDSLTLHNIVASSYITLTDDAENYICADRDTDTWAILTAISDVDNIRYIPYVMAYKRTGSTNLHTQLIVLSAHGEVENARTRKWRTTKYDREPGALENLTVTDTTLAISASGGGIWNINYRYALDAISTATRQFECINTIDGWQYYSHTAPVVRNTVYNDSTLVHLANGNSLVVGKVYRIISRTTLDFTTCGAANNTALTYFVATTASTLGTGDEVATGHAIMTDTYWGIIYVWRGIENEDHIYTIVVPEQFATIELAKASKTLGESPPLATSHAMLIGRIVFQKGQTTNILCESAFDTVFQASSALTSHTALSNLGADDHTQYFNQARGDARYVQGNTAITAGTGIKITYDAKGLITSTAGLAIADLPIAAATTVTTQALGDTGTVGVSTDYARQDHKHVLPPPMTVVTAVKAATQAFTAASTMYKVTFPTETFDPDAAWDNATNHRFTAPRTGYYNISVTLSVSASTIGRIRHYLNGTAQTPYLFENLNRSMDCWHGEAIVYLTAGQYIEIWAWCTTAGTTITTASTRLSIRQVR